MKILTICHAGAVRSVAAADLLRTKFGQDAIPISYNYTSQATFDQMCRWADRIVSCAEFDFLDKIPTECHTKALHLNLGKDVWGDAHNPALRELLMKRLPEILK